MKPHTLDICILCIADEIDWKLYVSCGEGVLESEDRRGPLITILPLQVSWEACGCLDVPQQVHDLEAEKSVPGIQIWGGRR